MNPIRSLLLASTILAMFSILASGETPSVADNETGTGIEGIISTSPVHGGANVGEITKKPLANTEFVLENASGAVTAFKTDNEGKFHVAIGPGRYTVAMKEGKPKMAAGDRFEVNVAAGKMTKVEWSFDSGLR